MGLILSWSYSFMLKVQKSTKTQLNSDEGLFSLKLNLTDFLSHEMASIKSQFLKNSYIPLQIRFNRNT